MKNVLKSLLIVALGLYAQLSFAAAAPAAEEFSENAVLCKTKAAPHKLYAAYVDACTKANMEEACQTDENIADPVSCKLFTSEAEVQKFWDDNKMTSIIECQSQLNGIGFRVVGPDTSEATRNSVCPASLMLKPVEWKDFGSDQKALTKAMKTHINRGFVKCSLTIPVVGQKILDLPGRDCTEETQRLVCAQAGAVPIGQCEIRKDLLAKKKK